jgi:hypothetical protein
MRDAAGTAVLRSVPFSHEHKVTSIYVNDQEKALRFRTEVLTFGKKVDFTQGPLRWLTIASPAEPPALNCTWRSTTIPAARAYQQAMFEHCQPAAMFYAGDLRREHDRMKPLGAEFTMPPTKVTGSTIAMLKGTCGNLIQIAALDRWPS